MLWPEMMLLRNPWFQNLSFTSPAVGGPQRGGKDASTKETRRRETEHEASCAERTDAGPGGRPADPAAGPEYDARSRSGPGRPFTGRTADASRPSDQGLALGEGAKRPYDTTGQQKEKGNASHQVKVEESSQREHQDGDGGREAAEAGRRDRVGNAAAGWWGEAAAKGAIVGPRASPDIVGVCRDWGLIVEAKLSVTPQAEEQLLRYKAVCRDVWPERRWVLVQVVRNWRAGVPYWVVGPGSWERARRMVAWHFQAA